MEGGGTGVLLSGGCNPVGRVDFSGFHDTIRDIKYETGLILNIHTGLVDTAESAALVDAGVDVISFDMVGSTETIHRVYGTDVQFVEISADVTADVEYLPGSPMQFSLRQNYK